MQKTGLSSAVLAILVAAVSSAQELPATPEQTDSRARQLMAKEDVKGMALALINDGKVVHVSAFGHRNVERELPLQTNTVMYGASLTKTAFAYMILQLVDEGAFDLDTPLHRYLARPIPEYEFYTDLAGDERWQQLTARHVLNHSTGFHNFRWLHDDRKLRFNFEPGARYGYSGEGFYLLQFVLEEGLGLDIKAEMQRRVFDRFDMPNTSMQWRDDFADNLADGYAMDGSFEPHDERSNVSAAGSMDTTIADQARMWAGIVRGDGLTEDSRSELVRAQLAIDTARQFPSLIEEKDERGPAIGLAAGLGLVTFESAHGRAFFKGGHNDWTGNMVVCLDASRDCIVLLANSVRAELIYPELVEFALGNPAAPWWWEYGRDQ